jgi:aspartyl-tRNA(Asn)/glutamyl-tRNA(Gln) amidotransferase subunit B
MSDGQRDDVAGHDRRDGERSRQGPGLDVPASYEPVIGLEIHVQLKTRTKMFCGCELSFGEPPNTRTCPVCLGLPGALPVVNAQAIQLGLTIGLALGSQIAPRSVFHRKNYFYPDLPKGYQISQYDEPLGSGGSLGEVRIHRVHLEEDAAKLLHVGESGRIHGSHESVVDFNRGGTPLAEIVTEPDLRSAEQAGEWLRLLRTTLRQLGVSDVNMEEGSLRCDANISLRPAGAEELGTKTELKNMNSFRFVERGIKAEIARQEKIIQDGGRVEQETLHYDPTTRSAGGAAGAITSLRSKEQAHDYRYFPEPDLLPVQIDEQMLTRARARLGELPADRARRFERELGLTAESAWLLAFRGELGDYFEAAAAAEAGVDPPPSAQTLANWIATDLVARLPEGEDPAISRVTPEALAALVGLVSSKRISVGAGRQVLDRLVNEGGDPRLIVQAEGLEAIGDSEELAQIVAAALAVNPDAAQRVREGNAKAIGPIVGHVMRETKGRADGGEVTRLVHEQLGI